MAGARLIKQGEQRRKKILSYIAKYQRKHGQSPTISEIAEGVGLGSPNATRNHLQKLVNDGVITMRPRKARSIVIIDIPSSQTPKAKAS